MPSSTEVIVSTFKNVPALALSLASLSRQSNGRFSICVAEDAQQPAVAEVAAQYGARHVSHADKGFRKNKILNDAIRTSTAEYLIFLDGDCIVHHDFVMQHLACARPSRYLSGGVIRLSLSATDAVSMADVTSGEIFSRDWLQRHGVWTKLGHRVKLMPWGRGVGFVLDRISLARKRWLGCNASTFRDNLITVNGFDETLDYGAEDKELGVRLENAGIRPYSIRYTAPILHLEHARDYVAKRRNDANLALMKARKRSGTTWTKDGLWT